MRRVTTLHARDRHFVIVQNNEGFYLAIEDKYLDENGCTTKALNGFEMHASLDLNMCIQCTKDAVDIDYLKSTGLSDEEAFKTWFKNKYEEKVTVQA